jgi:hypothetical protein
MNANEFSEMIDELLRKTEAGEVPWGEINDFMAAVYSPSLLLSLQNSSISLRRHRNDDKTVEFVINNAKGAPVVSVQSAPSDEYNERFNKLINTAIRKIRLVDETLADVNAFLKRK